MNPAAARIEHPLVAAISLGEAAACLRRMPGAEFAPGGLREID